MNIWVNTVIVSVFTFVAFFLFPTVSLAHPGRTASDGCHYCRTNCAKWGEVEGERHCHGGGAPVQQQLQVIPTQTPVKFVTKVPTRIPTLKPTSIPTRKPSLTPKQTPVTPTEISETQPLDITESSSRNKENLFSRFFSWLFGGDKIN